MNHLGLATISLAELNLPLLASGWCGLLLLAMLVTRVMLNRADIMDVPNHRSSHFRPQPKSGGLAIVITFVVGTITLQLYGPTGARQPEGFAVFVIAALAIAAISFYDDITPQPFSIKLAIQILASLLAMAGGLLIEQLPLPWLGTVSLGWLAYPLTLLWFLGMTNAFNFMDGLDGLAGGEAAIACGFFAAITLGLGSISLALTALIILAGVLGFLIFNFPPARIFMGDVGSAFLGFVFAALALMPNGPDAAAPPFLVVPLLLFNFIFDTTFTFFRRLTAGENVTMPHRTHLYQLMNRTGHDHRRVSLLHYGMGILQGLGALAMVHLAPQYHLLVFLPFLVLQTVYCFRIMTDKHLSGI